MTDAEITQAAPQTPAPEAETDAAALRRPVADIRETDKAVHLAIEMPGVAPDGVEVELEKRVLTIRATRAGRAPEGWRRAHREYDEGDYLRAFTLSDGIDADAIRAELRDGVLKLDLPRKEPQGPKKIAVSAA